MAIKILLTEPDLELAQKIKNELLKLEEEVVIVELRQDADIVISNRGDNGEKLLSKPKDLYDFCLKAIAEKHKSICSRMENEFVFEFDNHKPDFVKNPKQTKKLNSKSRSALRR